MLTCALAECDVRFRPRKREQRCCCEVHGKRHSHRLYRADGKEKPQPWGDRRRDSYHRRRALKVGASTGRPVHLAYIAGRDRWRCHLCRRRVDSVLAHPHPMSATLDHLIPLADGGAHDPVNVRLAHLTCNSKKGTRPANEQLMLIG